MLPEISEFFKTLAPILKPAWQIFKLWWWVLLPFIFWKPFLYFWLWWRNEIWYATVYEPILLEIRIPKEVVKPIRAMESVMAGLHGVVYHPPDWWEKWIEGQVQTSLSFEIVSIDGEIHFFVRIHKSYRDGVESAIYSQYPEAEITLADDYTKYAPADIPNKDWDLFAFDYILLKPSPYPIKTYLKFETEHEVLEEKRIDPIASLLEGMSKIKPGEQLWLQIRAAPMSEEPAHAFVKEGEKIRDTIAKRPEERKPRPIIQEAAETLVTGKPPEERVQKESDLFIAPELRMTPGEKEVVASIETKISKPIFKCGIRAIYLGKRGIWFKPNFRLILNFFNEFTTADVNALEPWGATFTKIHKSLFLPLNWLQPRRHYLRCRKIFRAYKERVNPFFPRRGGDKGIFILNIEELASLFHFPSWRITPVPGVSRVEARKGAPPELPTE